MASKIVNRFFKHRNGNFYYVINTSKHTETNETLVNYYSLYATPNYPFGTVWSRPLKMWHEVVEGKPRFTECFPPKEVQESFEQFLSTKSPF